MAGYVLGWVSKLGSRFQNFGIGEYKVGFYGLGSYYPAPYNLFRVANMMLLKKIYVILIKAASIIMTFQTIISFMLNCNFSCLFPSFLLLLCHKDYLAIFSLIQLFFKVQKRARCPFDVSIMYPDGFYSAIIRIIATSSCCCIH